MPVAKGLLDMTCPRCYVSEIEEQELETGVASSSEGQR